MKIIGQRIKEARTKIGLSQEALANALDVSKATISRYESGEREPKSEQLKKIANILHVSIAYLQGEELWYAHKEFVASTSEAAREMEEVLNLPSGTVRVMTEEEQRAGAIKRFFNHETDKFVDEHIKDISEEFCHSVVKIMEYLITLNETGNHKAVERISELVEISRYKKA